MCVCVNVCVSVCACVRVCECVSMCPVATEKPSASAHTIATFQGTYPRAYSQMTPWPQAMSVAGAGGQLKNVPDAPADAGGKGLCICYISVVNVLTMKIGRN
jgi:hypothetical protein